MINYPLIFICAALLGLITTPLLNIFAPKIKLNTSTGISLSGGFSIWFSFFLISILSLLFYKYLNKESVAILFGCSVIMVFGLIDDIQPLSVSLKFLTQGIAIILLVVFGVKTQIIFIDKPFNLILTFLWILGITNAFNHLDILDGLAAGIAVIVSAALFILAIFSTNHQAGILSLSLMAATLAFLAFNLPPAKLYMGNSGSHFLGFMLAAIAITISYAPMERKIALLSPIFIFGLPIFDTTFLILMRLKKRISPFKKSNDHMAHRLQALGFSKTKTLLSMYALGGLFSLSGIILSWVSRVPGIILITTLAILSFFIIKKMAEVSIDG